MFIWRTRVWRAICSNCESSYSYGDVKCENDGQNLVVCILPNGDPSSRLTNPQILLLRSETNSGPSYDGVFCKTRGCNVFIKGDFIKAKYPPFLRFRNAALWAWLTTTALVIGLTVATVAASFFYLSYFLTIVVFWGIVGVFVMPWILYFYWKYRPFRRWVSFRRANEGAPVSATMARFS